MKRLILLVIVVLVLASLVGGQMLQEPGYVMVSFAGYTVEMNIWFGAIVLFLLVVALYFTVWLLRRLLTAGLTVRQWRQRYRRRRIRTKTTQGMVHLMEGDWQQAQKKLTRSAADSDTPLPIYLAAARAAANNEDVAASEDLLREAHTVTPSAEIAIGLTKAELEIERSQYEQALATLLHLHKLNPKHKHVLHLLQQTYLGLEDWQGLQQVMPALRKQKVVQPGELDELEEKLALTLLEQAADARSDRPEQERAQQVQQVWKGFTKTQQRNPALVLAYAQQLTALNAAAQAEAPVREALQQEWRSDLVNAYGLLAAEKPQKQLQVIEDWLKTRSNDAELLLAAGRVSLRNKLWGKAREYFLTSSKINPTPQACAELSRLLRHMGDFEQSLDYTQRGFASVVNTLPELPMPNA